MIRSSLSNTHLQSTAAWTEERKGAECCGAAIKEVPYKTGSHMACCGFRHLSWLENILGMRVGTQGAEKLENAEGRSWSDETLSPSFSHVCMHVFRYFVSSWGGGVANMGLPDDCPALPDGVVW